METISIALICSVFGACATLITLSKNKTKETRADAKAEAKVEAKLDYIGQGVNSLTLKFEKFEGQMNDFNGRLIKVEESTKSAHHRIDDIERNDV